MEQQRPEFQKLDEADRKVLLWLMDNVHVNSIKDWINFIASDYIRRKTIMIDTAQLFKETQESRVSIKKTSLQ